MEEINCMKIATLNGGKWDNAIESNHRVYSAEAISLTVTTCAGGNHEAKILDDENRECRVRKLTENECFRLQGVKDEDYAKIRKNHSKSACYHLAGDSICTSVLMAIFGQMLGLDYETKIKELTKELSKGLKNGRD